jgi:hypothetical protein
MKRRTVLRSILAMPAAAALPLPAPAQQAKPAPETPVTETTVADAAAQAVAKTFSAAQFAALRKLADLVMPARPDTPGATDAGAAEFLDFLIGVSPADRQTLYKNGLDRLNADAHGLYAKPFAEISSEQAAPILAPLRGPWSYRGPTDRFARFLIEAKSDILEASANSREYIEAVSKRRRGAAGVGQYWYEIE